MTALDKSVVVGIVGAGAMGAGIAQVAAQAGHRVILFDAKEGAAAKGRDGIAAALSKLVDKGKMEAAARDAVVERIAIAGSLADLAPCGLVVEAIVEDLGVKRSVFSQLEDICGEAAILASNTSSLSITAIGNGLKRPERLVGMHFFNPAPLMALVEVVTGIATLPELAQCIVETAAAWGKVPVLCKSTPGFIVNRVARPFYAEGMRLAQEGAADIATIDAILREAGGFRMGPFELTDLIGHDVNFAVTRSVHAAFFNDPRFLPSLLQQELVEAGWLGRKTGRGFYDYAAGVQPPAPKVEPPRAAPAAIEVRGDLGPAEPLVEMAQAAGIAVTRAPGCGTIKLDGAVLMLTDGRTATEVAAENRAFDLVLFDLALDWKAAKRIAVAPCAQAEASALAAAAGFFQKLGLAVSAFADVPGLAVMRSVAMLANEASDTVYHGVASARDTDLAMIKGVNYPVGPLEWAERIGLARVLAVLDNLARTYGEDRYRASALLRRNVAGGKTYHA